MKKGPTNDACVFKKRSEHSNMKHPYALFQLEDKETVSFYSLLGDGISSRLNSEFTRAKDME